MVVHKIESAKDFKQVIETIPDGKEVVMLDCFAEWCGPCKAISPLLDKFSDRPEFSKVHFIKIDVDQLPDVSQELGIRAMPTFMIFKNGEKADEFVGANPRALEAMLTKAIA